MSASAVLVWFIIGVVVSIAVGNKLKINIGLVAIAFAYFIGVFGLGLKPSEVIALWPTKVMFIIMTITYFFGHAAENGSLGLLANHIVYRTRKFPALVPVAFFAAGALICFTGASPYAPTAALIPVVIPLCIAIGINPLAGIILENLGANATSFVPWGQGANIAMGTLEGQCSSYEEAYSYIVSGFWSNLMYATICAVIAYFLFRCWKAKPAEQFLEKPAAMNKAQKINLLLIVLMLAILLVPSIGGNMGIAFMATLNRKIDISFVCALMAFLATLFKVGDDRVVLTKRVPWNTIVMLCGVAMLVGVAQTGGAVDLIGSFIGNSLPASMAGPAVTFVAALMSLFVSGASVVVPTVYALVPSISATSGASLAAMYHGGYIGAMTTSISPFSGGGSVSLSCCPTEEMRQKLFVPLIGVAVAQMCVAIILSVLGLY